MDNGRPTLVLGRMPRGADPATHWAAGPWCFAEQEEFFPDWERRFTFAPEPLTDLPLQEQACAEVKALCADTLPALAARFCPHSSHLPPAYWETLLAPWAMNVAKQIVERWWRVKALLQTWGQTPLHVPLLPETCTFFFATGPDFVLHGSLGHTFNHWLFSRLLEPVFPAVWNKSYLPPEHKSYGHCSQFSGRARLREMARTALLRLPFPRIKGATLWQSLRFSLALLHRSHGPDLSTPLSAYGSAATGKAPDLPEPYAADPLPLFLPALPRLLTALRHPRRLRPDLWGPRLRVANVLAYEDAAYRQSLALWRGRGHRLMYVQHGSDYGQVLCLTEVEMVEYAQHAFATWGWGHHTGCRGNFIPLPHPQLARLAGRWQGAKSHNLLLVGTEMPAFGYRLDAHPSPLQIVDYRKDKARFFTALSRDLREKSFYRPYFPVPGSLRDADWVLERFPSVRLASGPLDKHLFSCRLLVLDHNGTTLLEALAADMPVIAFWRREAWPLTPESDALLDLLAQVGIWQPSPEAAAEQVAKVWDDPLAWWHSPAVQMARQTYCREQARTVNGSVNPYWVQTLKSL